VVGSRAGMVHFHGAEYAVAAAHELEALDAELAGEHLVCPIH
jgi:hypothetical protein